MKLTSILRTSAQDTNLVIQGVARTFLPQDLSTALEEIGATRSGAPTLVTKQPIIFTPLPPSNTTSPPPSTATFHLTFPSPDSARLARLAIPRSPARFLGFSAGPSAGVKRNPGLRVTQTGEDAGRWIVSMAGKEWVSTEGKRSHAPAPTSQGSSILDSPTSPTASSSPAATPPNQSLTTYLSSIVTANPAPLASKKKGHQVLLRGLPGSVTEESVRELGHGFRIDDTYGVFRVPKLQADRTSSHIISLPSPSEAYRFVRAVHNRRYGGRAFEKEFVMRAEVIW